MNKRINELLAEIRKLEAELRKEIARIRIETYEIKDKAIEFREDILAYHRKQMVPVLKYLYRARIKHILTAPVIWLCLFPALLMDLVVTFYQAVCFPVYGIPKVKRRDYVIMDRQYLSYLNVIEKLNCYYCGYFNGVIAYVKEVAARTEQYWCPIKHARQVRQMHSRYHRFTEFGDSDQYREQVETIRHSFEDLKEQDQD